MKEDAMIKRTLGIALSLGLATGATFAIGARAAGDDTTATPEAAAPAASGGATSKTSLQLVASSSKGSLKDPYIGNKQATAEGYKLFTGYGCNGCHGGGGGGICPPLIDGVWIYGGSDDTLFRLVTLGSVDLSSDVSVASM